MSKLSEVILRQEKEQAEQRWQELRASLEKRLNAEYVIDRPKSRTFHALELVLDKMQELEDGK